MTVNRYCSSSLQTIRMAAHAIKAGEGDVFVAAGVETVSRFMNGMADAARTTRSSPTPRPAPPSAPRAEPSTWAPAEGLPDVYIAMGQTAENVAEFENVSPRGAGRVRRPVPAAGHRVAGERLLGEGDHPGHDSPTARSSPRTTASAPAPPLEGLAEAQAGVPPRRHRHRRQRLPAQRRRRRRRRHERHQGQGARPHPAGPHRGVGRHRPQPRDHGPRPDRGVPPGAGRGPA